MKYQNLKRLRCFTISYLPATNTKGSRIKIKDTRHEKTVIIPFDYNFDNIKQGAFEYLKSIGIDILASSEIRQTDLLFADDFADNLI